MTKSENTIDLSIQSTIDLIAAGDREAIIKASQSLSPLLNINAILFGAKYGIKEQVFISALKEKLLKSQIELAGIKISDCAAAAMDYLGIQDYLGDNKFVKDLIKNGFVSL